MAINDQGSDLPIVPVQFTSTIKLHNLMQSKSKMNWKKI